jgi:hypothetical protein
LSRCGAGTARSGLEILPRRTNGLLEHGNGARGAKSNIDIVPAAVHDAAGGVAPVCPTFEPGDALIFDQLLVHRTMPGQPEFEPRYSLEIWTFAASHRPASYLPVAL